MNSRAIFERSASVLGSVLGGVLGGLYALLMLAVGITFMVWTWRLLFWLADHWPL